MKKGLRLAGSHDAQVSLGPADALMKKGLRPHPIAYTNAKIGPADALMKKGLRPKRGNAIKWGIHVRPMP